MKKQDTFTFNFYSNNYLSLIEQYDSIEPPLKSLFKKYIKPNYRVLDIGFGSGRDLKYIRDNLNADCYGVDSCREFVNYLKKDEYFKNRVFLGVLPDIGLYRNLKFNAILLIAVIMHLTKDKVELSIKNIRKILYDRGLVIISYSTKPRDKDKRFFEDLRGNFIQKTFIKYGFELIEKKESFDSLKRGIEWRSEVYRKI